MDDVQEMNPWGKFVHFKSKRARAQPGGYTSYIFSLKMFSCFNLRKKRWNEASHFKVGSSLNILNLEVSEIIS